MTDCALIIAHAEMSEFSFSSIVKKCGLTPWSPLKAKEKPDSPNEVLQKRLEDEKKSSVKYIIVESNYGSPGSTEINKPLLEDLIKRYPEAQILAFSATTSSLLKALNTFPEIWICHKAHSCLDFVAELKKESTIEEKDMSRIKDLASLKAHIQAPEENKEKASMKP